MSNVKKSSQSRIVRYVLTSLEVMFYMFMITAIWAMSIRAVLWVMGTL